MRLIVPQTMRPLKEDEYPANHDTNILEQQRQYAKLKPGYVLLFPENTQTTYKFFAQINVDVTKLWETFVKLTELLPSMASCFVNYDQTSSLSTHSPYLPVFHSLDVLAPYAFELCNDAFLEFGLIYHDDKYTAEVLVKSNKYLQVWAHDLKQFQIIMATLGLHEIDDLSFIDQFPIAMLDLNNFYCDTYDPIDIIYRIEREFSVN